MKPINDLQRAAVTVYESEMKDDKADLLRYEQQQKDRTPSPEPLDEPKLPVLSDVYLEDATVEAIAPALIARPRGSGIVKEELSGWFLQLNTYKKSGGGDESFSLQSHGGRPSKVNRKTSPTRYVPATTLSITGTIQPVILRQVLTSSHIGSGMAVRFLFAMLSGVTSFDVRNAVRMPSERELAPKVEVCLCRDMPALDFGSSIRVIGPFGED